MSRANSWNSETVYAATDPLRILSLGSSGTLARVVLTFSPSSKTSRRVFYFILSGWEGMEIWLETGCRRREAAAYTWSIFCKFGCSDSTLNVIYRKSGMVGAMYWRSL